MSFNRLTIQSLQAARQRTAYSGFSGLGTTMSADTRPSVDYVKAGDVIRVDLTWFRPTGLFADVPALYARFKSLLSAVFNVVAMSPQEYWISAGGNILIDVQPRGDFGKLADVVSIVMNRAQTAGINVDVARTRGEFITKVETTGGVVQPTLPDPAQTPGASDNNGLEGFFGKLTASPVTLAVILGAAVVLVIAAKK